MANESFIAVPAELDNPIVLRRFLSRLVEQLDVVFGNRGGESTSYVEQRALIDSATSLSAALELAQSTLDSTIKALEDTLGNDTQDIIQQLETLSNNLSNLTDRVTANENIKATKGFMVDFTVDASNVIQTGTTYNVKTPTVVATGHYRFDLINATYDSVDVKDNTVVTVSVQAAASTNSEAYIVEYVPTNTSGKFDVFVYELVISASKINRQAYDLQPGDTVSLLGLYNAPGSTLPPT